MLDKIIPTFNDQTTSWTKDGCRNAVILMSGGVDSSAAAVILLKKGYSVAGLTMNISDDKNCFACRSAASVCRALSIPHFYADASNEFKTCVSEPFRAAYSSGMTPNPCADCNEHIKFGILWDMAESAWGKNIYIATGHYARIIHIGGRPYLSRGVNRQKDQSYFLSGIPSDRIGRIIFPLGDYESKEDVRALVRHEGLSVSEQPESMDICFAHERASGYRDFLDCPRRPGPIKDISGKVIGTHNGITGYTLGQRKGIGIASQFPLFVVDIRPLENSIVVAPRDSVFSETVTAGKVNILAEEHLDGKEVLFGKIRSQGDPVPCNVMEHSNDTIYVRFHTPVFAPSPGQRLVLYTADGIVTAGGTIKNS